MVLAGELSALNNVSEDFLKRDVETKSIEIKGQAKLFEPSLDLNLKDFSYLAKIETNQVNSFTSMQNVKNRSKQIDWNTVGGVAAWGAGIGMVIVVSMIPKGRPDTVTVLSLVLGMALVGGLCGLVFGYMSTLKGEKF